MSPETPSDPFDRYISPEQFGALAHPVDAAMARASARSLVGVGALRGPVAARREWWDLLRRSETPEQRLTCQRMIDALGIAIGLQDWAEGRALCERNRAAADAFHARARELEAVAEWVGFGRAEEARPDLTKLIGARNVRCSEPGCDL